MLNRNENLTVHHPILLPPAWTLTNQLLAQQSKNSHVACPAVTALRESRHDPYGFGVDGNVYRNASEGSGRLPLIDHCDSVGEGSGDIILSFRQGDACEDVRVNTVQQLRRSWVAAEDDLGIEVEFLREAVLVRGFGSTNGMMCAIRETREE